MCGFRRKGHLHGDSNDHGVQFEEVVLREHLAHGLSPVPHFFGLLAVLLLRDSRLSALPIVREPVRD